MEDIRRLHLSRFSAINPLSNMIDHCAGVHGIAPLTSGSEASPKLSPSTAMQNGQPFRF